MREYSRYFHASIREIGEMRLIDFLQDYGEALEEAKERQKKMPSPPKPRPRRHR